MNMQIDSLLLFGCVAVAFIVSFALIIYMQKHKSKTDALKNKTIEYYKDQIDELEWQYERKCMALKVFVVTGAITFLCSSISMYIYFSGNHFYLFHIATLISLSLMVYYNYLNREALTQSIDHKRL